ncbi:hypothetical protein [Burkholderia cenocepacia]|uniref:hypothetical protein n=1 Tax=Burkholderia cenocepacia TaxID=95486 RepID=UPI00201320DF|nr:hypothetical protein [Burkholderia cenocepacia]
MRRTGKILLASVFASLAFSAYADGVPPSQWTPKEQQLVQMMRSQYQQQGLPFTDEQAGVAVQNMRTQMAKFSGSIMGMRMGGAASAMPVAQAVPVASAAPTGSGSPNGTSATSEAQIGAQFAAFSSKNGPVDIEYRSDGFVVNGQVYVDPEGRISGCAYDVMTGDIGYAVSGPSSVEIKLTRGGTSVQPLQIATATQMPDGSWQVVTTSGKTMNGTGFAVLPDGVLVSRGTVAFRYTPGKGISNITVPKGYVLAAFQHGNVGTTGYVLLEKSYANQQAGQGDDLMGDIRSLGSIVGIGKKEDYALMNTSTGQLYSFNVDVEGKQGSLFTRDNGRNMQHYFWRIYWLDTPSGPIAVSLEDGQRHVYITDLNTGKKVVAFSRSLGVSDLSVKQANDGTVSLSVRLGFDRGNVADASAFLQENKDVKETENLSDSSKS